MPLALDYSQWWRTWSLTESVVFTSIATGTNTPPQQALAVSHALRGQPSVKERAPTGGVYQGSDLLWCLPGALLGGQRPKPGDTVKDQDANGAVTWTVLNQDYDQIDQVWQLYCVNLQLHFQLYESCTFKSPTNAQDAAGSRVPTFAQSGSAVNCRFQLTGEDQAAERGKILWKKTYDLFLAEEVSGLTHEWQCLDSSGEVYEVISVRNRSRIDELSVVTLNLHGD